MSIGISGSAVAVGADASTGVVDIALTCVAGEGLLALALSAYPWGAAADVSSVVWDPAGDNQALVQVGATESQSGGVRKAGLYGLAQVTSSKTSVLRITASATGGDRQLSGLVRRVTGHDTTSWVRHAAQHQELDSKANNLPVTVLSQADDFVVSFGDIRDILMYVAAGDAADFVKYDNAGGALVLFSGTKAGAAPNQTVTFEHANPTNNYDNALFAVSLAPAAGDPPGTVALEGSANAQATATATLQGTAALQGNAQGQASASATLTVTPAAGTISLLRLRNPAGSALAAHTLNLSVIDSSTAAQVLTLLGETTDASGDLAITHASLAAGSTYVVTTIDPAAAPGDACGARVYQAT